VKILVVTTSYPRWSGDFAGAFVHGHARWLRSRGHEVSVVAAGPGDEDVDGIPVRRIDGGELFEGGAPERLERSPRAWLAAPVFAARLALAVRRLRADAVVSHWLVPSGIAAAQLGIPHLAVAHSGDVHLIDRLRIAPLVRRILRDATIAFTGAHLRDRLGGAARSIVCPMGVEAAPAREREPDGTVGFLGRLVPIKGVEHLIDAMALVGGELVVGGDGPLRPSLEARARARGVRARFLGAVPRHVLFDACDLVAAPSIDLPGGRTEGTPTVVLEALAAGVPVVASDVGGVRASAGARVRLVPPADPVALAEAITGERSRGRLTPAREFAWEAIGPRLSAPLGIC
jgi:glycosyltransferase involved in cell wall biosynthesis